MGNRCRLFLAHPFSFHRVGLLSQRTCPFTSPSAADMTTLPGPVFQANMLIHAEDHAVTLYDTEPGGLVCIAVNTHNNIKYVRTFSYAELRAAKLTKSTADYFHLVESLYFTPTGTKDLLLHSSLAGMRTPEPLATAAAADHYLNNVAAGSKLTQVLSKGLIALCKDKPMGLQAITRLGKWLLENNPNKPKVELKK
ncbi:Aste57867_18178 [Aphanomyces stellatus]|uniref:Aste57867_18178 protein n=1 Tax=Aphanomyces stellatus TaxID=120398 RepID=A0A485LA18_9STRA|nr:hypothetical protein As57867_018116 [Aphanomyces stellatus]VFT94916.1 Aste57867_18178 [Aphanomyces stellatus]